MRKAARARHLGVERLFARMPKGRVAEIVRQRQGLGEVLVEPQHAGDGAGDLRHFEAVGQARPVMVALVIDKDLRLVLQPAKRARMEDAVAVALKRRAHRVLGLGMEPAATFFGIGRIGRSRNRPNHGPTLRRPAPGVYSAVSAARSSRRAPMFPDLPESRRDVLGMRRGVLGLPQPRLAIGRVMDDEIFSRVLSTVTAFRCLRPRPQLNGYRVGFRKVADHRVWIHGLKFRSKKALWTVSPSGSTTIRSQRCAASTQTQCRRRPSGWIVSYVGWSSAFIHVLQIDGATV